MLCRAVRVCSRILLVLAFGLVGVFGLVMITPMQALQTARITVVGKVRAPISRPVGVAVRFPAGYGLSSSERHAGWAPLNDERQVTVELEGADFTAEMPPVLYCTHMWVWQGTPPPPPPWLVLRFSDAPSEEYVVWSAGDRSGYFVRGLEGNEVPESLGAWRIRAGRLRRQAGDGQNRWLLDLDVERRSSEGSRDDREGAA